jgi:hypothetical protein
VEVLRGFRVGQKPLGIDRVACVSIFGINVLWRYDRTRSQ